MRTQQNQRDETLRKPCGMKQQHWSTKKNKKKKKKQTKKNTFGTPMVREADIKSSGPDYLNE